ncbi:MAG TPA: class I SAM-dependent methyltransferase [Acidimicrobiales bacterium]|nr:class I SAM-dependent methyltransferase [Acidimicrobiales bacterium]
MSWWEDQVLPRAINVLCGTKELRRHREEVVAGLHGSVVEIGFGSGLNVPLYSVEITRVYAVDPSGVGRKLSAKRLRASPTQVEFVGLDGQDLPLGDASVDGALSTFTMCTIPDLGRALAELHRVLRPGGQVHFLEHGLAADPEIAHRQHRFNGFQRRVAGGCNLDRPIDLHLGEAGFEIASLKLGWLAGPRWLKPWNYLYKGVAIKPT